MGGRDAQPDCQHSIQRASDDLFTSNYVDDPDSVDPDALLFRIGFRMRSRLHEMCEFIEMDGADYRELPPNGNAEDLVMLWKRGRAGPARRLRQAAAQGLLTDNRADLKWPGGKAGGKRRRRLARKLLRAGSLPSHPVLFRDLQLLQLQSGALRRGCEGPLRQGPRARDSGHDAVSDPLPADSIYFGGGTPSLLAPSEVAQAIEECRRQFALHGRRGGDARGQSRNRDARDADRISRSGGQPTQLRRPVVSRRGARAPRPAA